MNNSTFKAIAPNVNTTLSLAAVALTVGLTFSINAAAKSMSEAQYKFLEKNIEVEFTAAKDRCNSVTGSVFDNCIAKAESIRKASKSELDAQRKIVVSVQPGFNTSQTEASLTAKSINMNSMPVIDKLNSGFKK